MDFDEHADPPLYCTVKETSIFSSDQFPEFSDVIRMCKVCNLKGKKLCNIYIYIYIYVALHHSATRIYILQLRRIALKNSILQIFIESIVEIW